MSIELTCPHCHAIFMAGVNLDNTKNRCPRCAKILTVPEKTMKPNPSKKGTKKEK